MLYCLLSAASDRSKGCQFVKICTPLKGRLVDNTETFLFLMMINVLPLHHVNT